MRKYNNFDISGIYCIQNKINHNGYIGSSVNIRKRINCHISDLRQNIHHSKYLQNSFNKYGEGSFNYFILAICPQEYLIKLEQRFIDVLKPEYNIAPKAGSTVGIKKSKEQIERNRLAQLGRKWTKEAIDKRNETVRKILYQYSINGEFIAEYKGVRETGDKLGIPWQAIIECCRDNSKTKQAGNFQWRYYKVDKLPQIIPRKRYKKKILQFNENNEYINEFESAVQAAKQTNINKGNICTSARNNGETLAGGYRWKYD